jgi:hypothetical protein
MRSKQRDDLLGEVTLAGAVNSRHGYKQGTLWGTKARLARINRTASPIFAISRTLKNKTLFKFYRRIGRELFASIIRASFWLARYAGREVTVSSIGELGCVIAPSTPGADATGLARVRTYEVEKAVES